MQRDITAASQRKGAEVQDGSAGADECMLHRTHQQRISHKSTQNNIKHTHCHQTCERKAAAFKTERRRSKNVRLSGGKGQEVKHPHSACGHVSLCVCVFSKPEID